MRKKPVLNFRGDASKLERCKWEKNQRGEKIAPTRS